MKKLILSISMLLITGFVFGQSLEKGNLIGMHVMTIHLDPDVTMNQFLDFMSNKFLPEMEKGYPGWKGYLVKGIRGENENAIGLIFVIKSEEHRDRYYDEEGQLNDQGKALREKYQGLMDELTKLGTWSSTYTDWLVL